MVKENSAAAYAQACMRAVCDLRDSEALNLLSNGLSYPLDKWAQEFKRLAAEYEKLNKSQEATIRVAVVGAYSAGKSCFINSILGEDNFVPVAINPTTQGITRFVYGNKKAIYDDKKQISHQEYCQLIQQEGSKEFRVTYPCAFLRHKELIDTVGLFEPTKAQAHWEMPKKDKELIRQADVLLYVTDGNYSTLKEEEKNFLCEILDPEAEKIPLLYIILNKIDRIKESDRKALQKDAERFCTEQNWKLEKCMPYCSLLAKTHPDYVQARERVHNTLDELEERYTYILQHEIATKKARLDRELKKCCNNIKRQLPSITQIKKTFADLSVVEKKEKSEWSQKLLKVVEDIARACLKNRSLVRSRKSVEENSGMGGVWTGAAVGAVGGSFLPVVGTLMGGLIGAVVGGSAAAQEEKFEITIAPVFNDWKTHFNKQNFSSKKVENLARLVCQNAFDTEALISKLTDDFDLYLHKTASERDDLKIAIPGKALWYIRKWAKAKINPAATILAQDFVKDRKKSLQKAQTKLDKFKALLGK